MGQKRPQGSRVCFGETINPTRSERGGVTWSLVVGCFSVDSSRPDESKSREETRNRAGLEPSKACPQ